MICAIDMHMGSYLPNLTSRHDITKSRGFKGQSRLYIYIYKIMGWVNTSQLSKEVPRLSKSWQLRAGKIAKNLSRYGSKSQMQCGLSDARMERSSKHRRLLAQAKPMACTYSQSCFTSQCQHHFGRQTDQLPHMILFFQRSLRAFSYNVGPPGYKLVYNPI